ncbi:hypothetical protein [Myxococcus xanthus]|uniref:hypothetical protein n=1 Tax=Myxococcus xanthus TaxID=34 RepID=UPI0020A3401B|nr:hypothetical protein [Myxococcus xanthus]
MTAPPENPPPEAENAALTPKATGISALNVARGTTKQVRPVAVAPSNKRAAGARDSAAAPSDATSAKEAEVLRRYEAGDLAAARDLAQAEKLTALHGQLIRFETAEAQAKKALAQRDFTEAIAQLTLAISVDDALAHGWSKHGPPLRKQLSRLHVQVGTEHAIAGRVSEARAAFEQALKHDTGNREAREQLGRLTGASAP